MAICEVKTEQFWPKAIEQVRPVRPVTEFKNYIAYQKQRKLISDGFNDIFKKVMAEYE